MRSLVVVRLRLLGHAATRTIASLKDQHNGTSCKRRPRHRYFGFGNVSFYRPTLVGFYSVTEP